MYNTCVCVCVCNAQNCGLRPMCFSDGPKVCSNFFDVVFWAHCNGFGCMSAKKKPSSHSITLPGSNTNPIVPIPNDNYHSGNIGFIMIEFPVQWYTQWLYNNNNTHSCTLLSLYVEFTTATIVPVVCVCILHFVASALNSVVWTMARQKNTPYRRVSRRRRRSPTALAPASRRLDRLFFFYTRPRHGDYVYIKKNIFSGER